MSTTQKQIFILSGQSNMSGRGGVSNQKWDHKIPPECGPSPSILRLTSDLTWVTAVEPLRCGSWDAVCEQGTGCNWKGGGGFRVGALRYRRDVDSGMGQTDGSVREYVRRGRKAKEEGAIKAVLWFQGESNSFVKEDAQLYKGRMERLVEDLRADLQEPHLLIVQVVRSRLQEQGFHSEMKYKGALDCVKLVFQKEGIPGFYRGCATNLLRTTPAAAITFTSLRFYVQHLIWEV